jgi:hypothetical protein
MRYIALIVLVLALAAGVRQCCDLYAGAHAIADAQCRVGSG